MNLARQFNQIGITQEDQTFLNEMFMRFSGMQDRFEYVCSLPVGDIRPIMIGYLSKTLPRSGWLRIGVPKNDIQSVADHSATCTAIALTEGGNEATKLSSMMLTHDHVEVVVGDFTPYDPITPEEKFRLESIAFDVVFYGSSKAKEIKKSWLKFEEQKTSTSHKGSDIDRLEMILQAQIYEAKYPHLKDALQEFWDYVDLRLKTDWGKEFFSSLRENHPNIHPLKAALSRPAERRSFMEASL